MQVAIRVDSGAKMGSGHVMRCLTLAGGLSRRGANVVFLTREHPGHWIGTIEEAGYRAVRLPPPLAGREVAPGKYGVWLGATLAGDAADTMVAMGDLRPDWLVVDHYAINAAWERSLRSRVGRILVIDDLADRAHECDVLLDQNYCGHGAGGRYDELVPARARLLLGPRYALLQPEYVEYRPRAAVRRGPIRRILVFFGGVDSANLTERALAACMRLNRAEVDFDVVVGSASRRKDIIAAMAEGRPNVHLHGQVSSLAPLIAGADLAIGASGTTSWERICLGLPTLVVTLSENQMAIAEELDQQGLVSWLGHRDQVDEGVFFAALEALLESGLEESWSRRCLDAMDANGCDRVSAGLIAGKAMPLRVRKAGPGDEALLLAWANDPVTRANAFSTDPITLDTHKAWYQKRLRDLNGCRFCIVESDEGLALGHVRFDRLGDAWEVDYGLDPAFRGCGLGAPMLGAALGHLRAEFPGALVLAQVKGGNRSSSRVFEILGFEAVPNAPGDESVLRYRQESAVNLRTDQCTAR